MEYKLLEEQDLELMLDFVDDENTKYNVDVLKKFIDNKNDFGFIAKINNKIVGFAFGYILLKWSSIIKMQSLNPPNDDNISSRKVETCNTIRNSNYRPLNCPMKSASRQLQSSLASSITHLPTGVVSARLAAKKLSLAVVTK